MSVHIPWMPSLLKRMKELYNKPNAKTIAEALPELGSGGDVSPSSVAEAIGDMNATQRAQALDDLGGEPQKIVVSVTKSGSNYSVDKTYAQINAAYQAGASVVFSYGGTAIANFDDSGIEDAFVVEICNYVSNGPEQRTKRLKRQPNDSSK